MWFRKDIVVAVASLCAVVQTPALAQRVSGIVRDTGSANPLSGAVVSAMDAANQSLGRAITDGTGRYFIEVTAKATRLRIVRIGFQPLVMPLPLPSQRGGTLVMDAWMTKVPTLLTSLGVNDDRVCSTDLDRTGAVALWDQARAGLLASVVAREKLPATAMVMKYERMLDLKSGRVIRQRGVLEAISTSRPFVAADAPDKLAENGYLEENGSARRFKGPDADVLLDDSFARTHCFSVQPADSAHADAIGLAFEPAKGRDQLMDIRGTLWVAAGVPQLRSLEYRYTGGDPAWEQAGASGVIQFRTMPNGVAFVDLWKLRIPVMVQATAAVLRNGRLQRGQATLRPSPANQMSETGGVVLSATWPDELHWDAALSPLSGTVIRAGSGQPIPGALVIIEATGDSLVADSLGHFFLSPVIPGRYAIDAADTTFASFLLPRTVTRDVVISPNETLDIRPEVPSLGEALKAMCSSSDAIGTTSVLLGRLLDRDRTQKFARDTRVVAAWLKDGSTTQQETQTVSLDDQGRFSICGVPRDERTVLLSVTKSGAAFTDTSVTIGPGRAMMGLEWKVSSSALGSFVAPKMATLRGHVTREGLGTPIPGAAVWFPALDRRATTDANGAFFIGGIQAGGTIIQVRSVSSQLKRDTITIAGGADLVRNFALAPQTAVLDTIRTVASSLQGLSPALRGFEERREKGMGGFFMSDSVLRRNDEQALSSILLSRVAGLTLIPGRLGATYMVSSRKKCTGPVFSQCSAPNCYVTVYMDGVRIYAADMNAPPVDATRIAAADLAGVEFYPGGGTGPSEYNATGTQCGTLLLWTRLK